MDLLQEVHALVPVAELGGRDHHLAVVQVVERHRVQQGRQLWSKLVPHRLGRMVVVDLELGVGRADRTIVDPALNHLPVHVRQSQAVLGTPDLGLRAEPLQEFVAGVLLGVAAEDCASMPVHELEHQRQP